MANALKRRLGLLERRQSGAALLPQVVVVPFESGPERTEALSRLRRLEASGVKTVVVMRHGDTLDRDPLCALVEEMDAI